MKPVVIKRDGCRVPFDIERIRLAVLAAGQQSSMIDDVFAQQLAERVLVQFQCQEEVDIHTIESCVEHELMVGPDTQCKREQL